MIINQGKLINNFWVRISLIFLFIAMLAFYYIEKNNSKPISIGFVAQLTGKQAELGVQERNGVQLAIEKLNGSGGINGHKIELKVKDDFGVQDKAEAADRDLIKEGVIAIIGHATTAQTLAGLKVTDAEKIPMISPTVSTPELSGLDDYFFRVYPSFNDSAKAFAKYIYSSELKHLSIIYDIDNADYSNTYSSTFSTKFESLGGEILDKVKFSSVDQPDFTKLIAKLRGNKTEGVLIIASDIDTAIIAQRVRLSGWQVPLFTSAWAQTETLINNGGSSVEGMKLEQSYALTSDTSTFIDFKTKYKERFGNDPSFGAAFGYEAALVLAGAIEKNGIKTEGLKRALLATRNFNGLIDNFSIDEYGDVQRPFYLSSINNGKFVILQKLTDSNEEASK